MTLLALRGLILNWKAYMLSFYTPTRNFESQKRDRINLPQDWSDYLVYMTREALKSVTGSMNEICSGTENFFLQMNRMLAYERTMRDLAAWTLPAAAPWMSAMPQSWTGFAPHQLGAIPSWQPLRQHFPFMSMTSVVMQPYTLPSCAASLAPYYATMPVPVHPSIWSFNPHLTRYM